MTQSQEETFSPAWWLPGAHAQTIWGTIARRTHPVSTRLRRLPTGDGDVLYMHTTEGRPGAPTVLLLHGLEGSLRSHYIQGMLARCQAAGWTCTVLEFRGCGGRGNLCPRFYHSGETTDLDFVVQEFRERRPRDTLFVAGYSLGGNVLLKWLGERGSDARIDAGAVVSAPIDLAPSGAAIDRSLGGIYRRHFLKGMIPKALRKAQEHPGILDEEGLRNCRTLRRFDDLVTAPLHGFTSSRDYYDRGSSLPYLERIRVPTLLVHSMDDPLVPRECIPRRILASQGCLQVKITQRGGHLGFVSGGNPLRPVYWAEDRVVEFFERQAGGAEIA